MRSISTTASLADMPAESSASPTRMARSSTVCAATPGSGARGPGPGTGIGSRTGSGTGVGTGGAGGAGWVSVMSSSFGGASRQRKAPVKICRPMWTQVGGVGRFRPDR